MKDRYEELIDRYISYDMTGSERTEFEQLLSTDPILRERFLATHLLSEALHLQEEKGIKEVLSDMDEAEINSVVAALRNNSKDSSCTVSHSPKRYNMRWIVSALVACVVLGIIFYTLGTDNYLYTTSEVYVSYFSEAPEVEYSRSGSGMTEEAIGQNELLIQSYNTGQYAKVVHIYEENWKEKVQEELPQSSLLLVAYSLSATNRNEEAILLLKQLVAARNEYSEEAEWLLLGAYLKSDDKEAAESTAQKIMTQDSFYAAQAGIIYEQLNKKK